MKLQQTAALAFLALAFHAPAFPGSTATYAPPPATPSTVSSTGDWTSAWGVGAQIGIQGAGIHLRYDLNPSFYLRLEGNLIGMDDEFTVEDVDFSGDIDFSNLGLTINYLPFANSGFRITAGAFFGQNEANGRGEGGTAEFNGHYYTLSANDTVQASLEYDSFNPYLGIGWDWTFGAENNFVLGLDLGVAYMGNPEITVNSTGIYANNAAFNADVAQYQKDAEDFLEDWQFLPVVKLSFTWRF